MKRSIEYLEHQIEYEIVYKDISKIYIALKEGKVILRCHNEVPLDYLDQLVLNKAEWILKNLQAKANPYFIEYLGKSYEPSIFEHSQKFQIRFTNQRFEVYFKKEASETIFVQMMEQFYTSEANKYLLERSKTLIHQTQLQPKRVSLKKMQRSLGRCNSRKEVVLNIHLMKYDPVAIDYVIVHELCHLKHMNHSPSFYRLVESFLPDYKKRVQKLKEIKG